MEVFIKNHLKHDVNVEVASNPEFFAQGTAVKDTLNASRIVIGVEIEQAKKYGINYHIGRPDVKEFKLSLQETV